MNRNKELSMLGSRIKSIRVRLGYTQIELASVCGLNRNYIGMLERGERNPTYLTLVLLANRLKISLSEIIG